MKPIAPALPVLQPFEVILWGERKDQPLYREMVQSYSADEAKEATLARWRGNAYMDFAVASAPVPKITRVDVLDGHRVTPHQRQRGLFEDLAECCINESLDDIQGATVNLLLTAVQRRAQNQADALTRWDELMGRGKQALIRRYSGTTDNRDKAAETEIAKKLFA